MCVDLRELIQSAVATLQGVARRKHVELALRVEGGGPASLDSKLVRRAVEDLLGNALKYTPPGKDVSVTVRHPPGSVVIEVADRGPGIPEEMRAGILRAPADGNGSGMHQCVGLGLYMVEQVAEAHRGTLEILDREGGGALFRLELRSGDPAARPKTPDSSS